MKSFERRTKVAKAIQRELGILIQHGAIKDDRLDKFVSIVDVDLNPSLSSAKVIYSVMAAEDEDIGTKSTQAAFDENSGYLRGLIGRKLNLKYAPKLIFVASDSLSKSVDMIDLIKKTVQEDELNKEKRNDY